MNARKVFLPLLLAVLCFGAAVVLTLRRDMGVSLHVLDVGQGDAILLRAGNADILVDGGPDASVLSRLGAVRPSRDRTIEVLVLTHPQEDHLRGLLDVLSRERVGLVLLPNLPARSETFRTFVRLLQEKGVSVRAAHAGQRLTVGALSLRVLAPDVELLRRGAANANAASVVLRGSARTFSFLLTGDIEAPTEEYLRRRSPAALRADILKVPHHGSKTSSFPGFLRAVRPRMSIVSVGAQNRYGHPHESVVRRYPKNALLRTDRAGTVSLTEREDGVLTLRCAASCTLQQ